MTTQRACCSMLPACWRRPHAYLANTCRAMSMQGLLGNLVGNCMDQDIPRRTQVRRQKEDRLRNRKGHTKTQDSKDSIDAKGSLDSIDWLGFEGLGIKGLGLWACGF